MNERDFQEAAVAFAHAIVEKHNAIKAWEDYGDTPWEDRGGGWEREKDDELFAAYLKKVRQVEELERELLRVTKSK